MSSYYTSADYSKNPFIDESPKITVVINNNVGSQNNNVVETVAATACACCMMWFFSPFHFFRIF